MYSEEKFITKLLMDLCIKNKKIITIYGDGRNIIKAMYIKDVIFSLISCLSSKLEDVTTNLGQYSFTVEDFVFKVANIFNKKVSIEYSDLDTKQKYIHFEEENDFCKIFNYKLKYNLSQGLNEFHYLLLKQNYTH